MLRSIPRPLFLSLVLCGALPGSAALLPSAALAMPSYEGFGGYAPGTSVGSLNGGYGWSGGWGGSGLSLTVASPGLSHPGLATSPGAATSGVPGGNVAWYYRDLDQRVGDGATLYLSVLLRPETGISDYGGLSLVGSVGDIFMGESGDAAMGSHAYGLESRIPDGPDADTDPDVLIDSSAIMASPGETALLVLKATLMAGPDLFALFVNPIPGSSEADNTVAARFLPTDGLDLGELIFIAINNAGNWTTDEIRIGATFASVTPAPAPGALPLLVAGLAALSIRRRRG